jgi:hypothetical protein
LLTGVQLSSLGRRLGLDHKRANDADNQQNDASDQRNETEGLMVSLMDKILINTAEQSNQSNHSNYVRKCFHFELTSSKC